MILNFKKTKADFLGAFLAIFNLVGKFYCESIQLVFRAPTVSIAGYSMWPGFIGPISVYIIYVDCY